MNIEAYSPPLWILKNGFINERGDKIEFNDHYFLFDIYRDMSPLQVGKKCSQIGWSVLANLKVIHAAKFRGLSTIYTMPSDDDVSKFVQTKTDKIIQTNPAILKELKTDSVGLKQIGDRFIHFKGTRSKSAPLSTTTDILVHDEIDRSDLKIIEQYRSRITFSKFKGIWMFSNPSTVNSGVDVPWQSSDKKEWFIKCLGCKQEQQLLWEENVDEIKKIYVCKNCGKELTKKERKLGRWIPTNPGADISGYHISQMMAPWLTAADLVKEKEDRGIDYFYNFILGEPYHVGTTVDFRQMITDCWTSNPLDKKPFFMGVDIGIEKHYVLGSATGIFEIGKVLSREQLEEKIDRYNPTVVMDAGPERTWAEEFKQKYPKLYLCFYKADKPKKELVKWGGMLGTKEDRKNLGYVWTDRNRAIDKVINEFLKGRILIYATREVLNKYIAQWETLRRIEEMTALGTKRYIWDSSTGEDHWAHATVYYWIARMRGSGKAGFEPDKTKKTDVIERTKEGFRMRSLKEIIEDKNL